jgi:hypothetical protein
VAWRWREILMVICFDSNPSSIAIAEKWKNDDDDDDDDML